MGNHETLRIFFMIWSKDGDSIIKNSVDFYWDEIQTGWCIIKNRICFAFLGFEAPRTGRVLWMTNDGWRWLPSGNLT